MFDRLLKTALDSGGEVIVETKYYCDGVKGRVLDFDGTHFTVFHSGTAGGMLWAFRIEDVAHCGLVLELPHSLSELSDGTVLSNMLEETIEPTHQCPYRQDEGESL
jgi:hypothetical protein